MRKPQRGVCGVCGCAVVAPSFEQRSALAHKMGCSLGRDALSGWANGHEVDMHGKLLKVRCPQHGGHGFPVVLPTHDATVQMG